MIPSLDVSSLPVAASFYSSVLQPLGLRYLSTDKDVHSPTTTSVIYGGSEAPAAIFQLNKTAEPKRSVVTLSAPTAEAAAEVHRCALRAHPDLASASNSRQFLRRPKNPEGKGSERETRARVTDPDGNRMDVVYMPPPGYPKGYNGSTFRRTECTTEEVSRILDWNYNVAASDRDSSVVSSRASTVTSSLAYGGNGGGREVINTPRTSVSSAAPVPGGSLATATKQQNDSGWNTTAVLGTVLGTAAGVVAGAALTYSVMKGGPESSGTTDQHPTRRSTLPNTQPSHQAQQRRIGYPPQTTNGGRLAIEGGSHSNGSLVRRNPARSSSVGAGSRKPLMLTDSAHRYAPSNAPSNVSYRQSGSGGRSVVVPMTPSIAPSSTTGTRVSRRESGRTRSPPTTVYDEPKGMYYNDQEDDSRPLMANIPLDPQMVPAPSSVASTRVSRRPSAPVARAEKPHHDYYNDQDDGRPLMANIPLDPSSAPAPQSVAPSRVSRRGSAEQHSQQQQQPRYQQELDRHLAYGDDNDDGRPLMANIPIDGGAADFGNGNGQQQWDNPAPARSLVSRSSFSRSKPFDDFEVVAEDNAYVLDSGVGALDAYGRGENGGGGGGDWSGQSRVSRSSRPPVTGGGGSSRYEGGGRMRSSSASRVGTQVSARKVPLPMSMVGDDNDSIAPGDSISCVGSRYH